MTEHERLLKSSVLPIEPSNIENIDISMFEFINERLNIHCTTNKGWKKVPVKWVSPEVSYFNNDDPDNTSQTKVLIYPIVKVERVSILKNLESKGKFYGQIPPNNFDHKKGTITISRKINQYKTANFLNADAKRGAGTNGEIGVGQINFPSFKKNEKIVYETLTVPRPEYAQYNYKITLITEYQGQMNEMLQKFINQGGYINDFILERNGHKYEGFISGEYEYNDNKDNLGEEERKFETSINIKIYGYTIGNAENQENPYIVKRENAVEVKIPREKVIFGDMNEYISNGKFRS